MTYVDSIELRMRQLAEEKLKLESRIACEDKMVYKRRSIDEPVKEEDSDSNDGPNEEEIMNLLQDDLPLNKPSEGLSEYFAKLFLKNFFKFRFQKRHDSRKWEIRCKRRKTGSACRKRAFERTLPKPDACQPS